MEDERGAGGHSDSGGVSEPPLSGKLADESVAENMGSGSKAEEVFEEGDGEEIMVEVVGSDVFVDGVGGNEGDCEMAEDGDLKGGVVEKNEEYMDVLREGDDNKKDESRDEKHCVSVEVDTNLSMSIGGELIDSDTKKDGSFMTEVKCPSTDGDSGRQGKSVLENNVCAAESKDSIPKLDAPTNVLDIQEKDASAAKSKESIPKPEAPTDVLDVQEKDVGAAESKDSIPELDAPTDVPDLHAKVVGAAESEESIPKPDAPIDVPDKSQNCSDDLHDAKLEPNDQTEGVADDGPESIHKTSLDTKKEEIVGTDECSKAEDGAETNKSQNEVTTSTPIQLADGDDAVEVNKTERLNIEVKDDAEENVQNKTSMSGSTDEEIVQSDSGICSDQPVVSITVGSEMGDQNVVIPSVKDVDEIPAQDDSADNIPVPESACSEVEIADEMVTEDPVPCHDPPSEGVANVVGDGGSPQSMEQVVGSLVTESSSHEADKLEKTEMMPNEVTAVAADSDTAQVSIIPEGNGSTEPLLSSTDVPLLDGGGTEVNHDDVYESREADETPRESNGFHATEALENHTSEAIPMEVDEETDSDRTYHVEQDVDAEIATEGPSSESDKSKMSNKERVKYSGSLRMKQSGYLTPPKDEGCFTPSDLVWGKVRSHPWWPGQIFDPKDASEKAVKHYKKDSYLVAYFGDQTFAWNDSSALKPFRSYFSQIEKQSNSESFHNAVNCALEEFERRVQLGLSCACIPKDDYAKIKTQILENTGIREESSQRYGVDKSSCASCFEPNELLDFIRTAAPCAFSGADRLDLVIARAQLSAFCSFKGYGPPIEFPSSGELLENDGDTEQISDEAVASHKRQRSPKEGAQSRKERNLMELMGDGEYSPYDDDESVAGDLGKKRIALDSLAEGSDKRASVSAAKAPAPTSQAPKPSFKIGECIRRVANQLTSSSSLVKGSNDEMPVDGSPNVYEPSVKQSMVVSAESLSVSDMLSQLELLAQDPKKGNTAQNQIRAFFMGFRSSIAFSRRGRKKKSEHTVGGSGEEFEFDDVNDSYWTDRIVQNYSAEQLMHDRINDDGSHQLVPFNVEKTTKAGRKPHSRKRFSTGNSPPSAPEFDENAKRIKQESSPAELLLSFAGTNRILSEISLNKMFRRFGPLMESETEVDHESGSAKVIFKRGLDAEVARNSAEKFSIFGPVVVSYQIGYSPVISVKILPVSLPSQEEAPLML